MIKKVIITILSFIIALPTLAANLDSDGDGLTDYQETFRYYLDPYNADTDGDGYNDNTELINGYSPHFGNGVRIINVDQDNDGLSDGLELAFGTDLMNPDSDGDGYFDGFEVDNGYDPIDSGPEKLKKHLEVYLSRQRLGYFLGDAKLGEFIVSTGKALTPTPIGEWKIEKKQENAWSSLAGLRMPYWMSFNGIYAIHELPEWSNGVKEGADHLGIPVSHGCIRLGVGEAEWLYNWTPIGTSVKISK